MFVCNEHWKHALRGVEVFNYQIKTFLPSCIHLKHGKLTEMESNFTHRKNTGNNKNKSICIFKVEWPGSIKQNLKIIKPYLIDGDIPV